MDATRNNGECGFTLIELLTVVSIIAVLAGLILGTAAYTQRKAAMSRAQTEIKAIEGACESYKADNGMYPMDVYSSGTVGAITNSLTPGDGNFSAASLCYNPSNFQKSCSVLYQALTGDGINILTGTGAVSTGKMGVSGKCYMELKPSQTGSTGTLYYIVDPFGFSYGYSTVQGTSGTNGYNPNFDLWSTAGTTSPSTSGSQAKWIKNW